MPMQRWNLCPLLSERLLTEEQLAEELLAVPLIGLMWQQLPSNCGVTEDRVALEVGLLIPTMIHINNTVLITANHFCRVFSGCPIADNRLIKPVLKKVKIKNDKSSRNVIHDLSCRIKNSTRVHDLTLPQNIKIIIRSSSRASSITNHNRITISTRNHDLLGLHNTINKMTGHSYPSINLTKPNTNHQICNILSLHNYGILPDNYNQNHLISMCPSKSQDKEDPPRDPLRDDEGKISNHNNIQINAVKEDKLGKIILPSKSTTTYKPNKLTTAKIQLGSSNMLPTKQCKAKMGNKTYCTMIVMPLLMHDINRATSHMSHLKNNIPTNNPPDLTEMEEDLLNSEGESEVEPATKTAEGKMTAHASHFLLAKNYEFSNITFAVIVVNDNGAKSSNPFVLNGPMGEQDYGQQPLIITHTEQTEESPATAPTAEMAGCSISKGQGSVPGARGVRNPRSRAPLTAEQRTARNKKCNERRRKREKEVKIARQRNLDPAPSPDPRSANGQDSSPGPSVQRADPAVASWVNVKLESGLALDRKIVYRALWKARQPGITTVKGNPDQLSVRVEFGEAADKNSLRRVLEAADLVVQDAGAERVYVVIVPRALAGLGGLEFTTDLQEFNTELHGLPANSILYKSSKRDTVTLGGKPEPRFRVFMEVSPEGEVYLASKGYFLQTLTSPVKVNLLQRHRDDN